MINPLLVKVTIINYYKEKSNTENKYVMNFGSEERHKVYHDNVINV